MVEVMGSVNQGKFAYFKNKISYMVRVIIMEYTVNFFMHLKA